MRSLVFIVFFLLTCTGTALSKNPMMGDKLTDSENAALQAMISGTDSSQNLANMRVFTMTSWPAARNSGLTIAAMGSDPDDFDVAVLKETNKGYDIISRINTDNDAIAAGTLDDLKLDVSP